MAAVTAAIAAVGLGLSAYGAYQNYQGQKDTAQAQQEALAIQKQQEAERKKAMELDAARRTREMVRQQVAARGMSLATTTNQGAEGGSALQGAYGGESGRTGVNMLGVSQNLEIGREMFGLNQGLTDAYSRMSAGTSRAGLGTSLMGFGTGLINNLGAINRVGGYVSSWGTNMVTRGGMGNFMSAGSGSFNTPSYG